MEDKPRDDVKKMDPAPVPVVTGTVSEVDISADPTTTISLSNIPKPYADALAVIADMKGTTRSALVAKIFRAWFNSDLSLQQTIKFVKEHKAKVENSETAMPKDGV